MARIVYGVMGDSRGHLSRSLAVAQSLPGHEFLFIGGGTVRELQAEGYLTHDAPMLETVLCDNKVDSLATAKHAVRTLLRRGTIVDGLCRVIEDFAPDLALSDYEYFTPHAAKKLGVPCLSLDHQHVLTHCVYERPKEERLNRFFTCLSIRALFSAADRFLVSSFYVLPPKDASRVEVFPPVLRRAVFDYAAREGETVLVYVRGGSRESVVELLGATPRTCLVYGFGERPQEGNCLFRPTARQGFLEDLTSCGWVLSNGGHSLISEALYFGKPVLCFPTGMFYEQFLNGYFLARLGYGDYALDFAKGAEAIGRFERSLERCRERIGQGEFRGNERIAQRIETLLAAPS